MVSDASDSEVGDVDVNDDDGGGGEGGGSRKIGRESVLRVLSEWDLFYESVQQLHWAYPSHTLEQLGHCMRPCRQSPPC